MALTDGYDLLHLPTGRAVYWKAFYDDPGYGVRQGQWKFYRNYKGNSNQLYNILTDKGEAKNVAAGNAKAVQQMNVLLDGFVSALAN